MADSLPLLCGFIGSKIPVPMSFPGFAHFRELLRPLTVGKNDKIIQSLNYLFVDFVLLYKCEGN